MGWMIIAPELIICWAIRQWLGAWKLMKKSPFMQSKWTMTHGYFLQMGGFVLKGKTSDILSAQHLGTLVRKKKVALPDITAKEIKDRSKHDGLSKLVATSQTTWFLAQCLTCKIQGLVTTELELITIAFAALNVFVYFFWWNKPMDVQTTVKVPYLARAAADDTGDTSVVQVQQTDSMSSQSNSDASRESSDHSKQESMETPATNLSLWQSIVSAIWTFVELPWMGIKALFERVSSMLFDSPPIKPGMKKIFTFYALNTSDKEQFIILVCIGVIGALFGGIHCISWDYLFPSHAEAIIWHVSSITITGIPVLVTLSTVVLYAKEVFEEKKCHKIVSDICEVLGLLLLSIAAVGVIPYLAACILLRGGCHFTL